MIPKDVLSHFNTAFAYAKQGRSANKNNNPNSYDYDDNKEVSSAFM